LIYSTLPMNKGEYDFSAAPRWRLPTSPGRRRCFSRRFPIPPARW
jgi:hypothetical protein